MVNLRFIADDDGLSKPGVVRSIYDPAHAAPTISAGICSGSTITPGFACW
jgi:hypothetical protein